MEFRAANVLAQCRAEVNAETESAAMQLARSSAQCEFAEQEVRALRRDHRVLVRPAPDYPAGTAGEAAHQASSIQKQSRCLRLFSDVASTRVAPR